jgi:hypothetical protein
MGERFCKVCRGWHSLETPWPAECHVPVTYARSSLVAPYVITDGLDYVQSMVDGKVYTSKAALRASYKAHGVVEVGNDPQRFKPPVKPKVERTKILEAVQKAKAQFASGRRFKKQA